MTIKLLELSAADERIRFSPFVWRTRMMLLHKGLEFERIPWHFTDLDKIAETGGRSVPAIHTDEGWISDSLQIAFWLDEKYPDNPLFADEAARQQARLILDYLGPNLIMPVFHRLAVEVWKGISPEDQVYFRESREKFFGCTLEEKAADHDGHMAAINKGLQPFARLLESADWLAGDAPGWLDYVIFGSLMWPHCISDLEIIGEGHVLHPWWERMMGLHGGHAAAAPTIRTLSN